MGKLRIIKGDITEQAVDAIVNAANCSLLGGGGVDGAIHRAAGPQLLEECRKFGGCNTGEARITAGYNLPARFVIHTPGPVYTNGKSGEPKLLRASYTNSLKLAVENNCKTVVFPSISTGVYGYPIAKAALIAISTMQEFIRANDDLSVAMICHSNGDFKTYCKAADELGIEYATE